MSDDLKSLLESATHAQVSKRGLTQASCRHMDYRVRVNSKGEPEHIAVYKDETGQPVWAKVRNVESKEFFSVPSSGNKIRLFGLDHVGHGGKMIVITEGEIDAVTVSQIFGNKWPVLSLSGGVSAAKKDISAHLDTLLKFEKVVLAFDMDEVGRKAALEAAKLFPPGKAHIAQLPAKDANEAHLKNMDEALLRSLHNAPSFRPDGIVAAKDLVSMALAPVVTGISWPLDFMTNWTYGRRYGELYTLGAGTGIGKSDLWNQVVAHTVAVNKEPTAVFNYEAGPVNTLKAVAGKIAGKRFHIPDDTGLGWTREDLEKALDFITTEAAPLFINDHFGAVDWPSVRERIRFLAHAEGVKHFFIDPITALVAQEEDERRALDGMIAEMAMVAQELNVCIYLASHLTRPSEGKSHEEGGRVQLKHFRGSNAIGMWSFFVFGMERNQQSDDEEERSQTVLRVLKDRYTGNSTGKTQTLFFNQLSGILEVSELDLTPPDRTSEDFPDVPPPL